MEEVTPYKSTLGYGDGAATAAAAGCRENNSAMGIERGAATGPSHPRQKDEHTP